MAKTHIETTLAHVSKCLIEAYAFPDINKKLCIDQSGDENICFSEGYVISVIPASFDIFKDPAQKLIPDVELLKMLKSYDGYYKGEQSVKWNGSIKRNNKTECAVIPADSGEEAWFDIKLFKTWFGNRLDDYSYYAADYKSPIYIFNRELECCGVIFPIVPHNLRKH